MTAHALATEALSSENAPPSAPRWWVTSGAVIGGAMIAGGALLPWFSFFAGLHPVAGVAGLNGRLLLAGGLLVMLAGGAFLLRGGRWTHRAIGWAGVLLAGTSGVLLVRLFRAHEQLSANPMMFAQLGPGLFVSAAGALVVAATLLVGRRGA